ncbi:MAG: menaquinone biosynthesis protein [Pontiellaceae bacterium]|nr:menaquinone biosynthesis protein [Pontiellaceae bacterium]
MDQKTEFVFAGAPYSNSAPLVDQLTEVDPRVRVINDVPANLVQALTEGRADVALIPTAHLLTNSDLKMLPGLGVAADGPVRSVLLKCNKRMGQIKTVARDPASGTSNVLAEILMRRYFKQKIEMVDVAAGERPDAVVMIGDRALCSDPAREGDIDLGEAWQKWTDLPFVFGVWAVRSDFAQFDDVTDIAHRAFAAGFRAMESIAERFADEQGRDLFFWLDYLDGAIHYRLGKDDMQGIARFKKELSTFF